MPELKKEYLKWKTSNNPKERLLYAKYTGDFKTLKNDEHPYNRRRYAENTGKWRSLKNDKDKDNMELCKRREQLFE